MNASPKLSGPRAAAEEIIPMPLLPRLFGGRALARQIEGRRRAAERIIEAHCLDRRLGLQALQALSAETRRAAISGRSVSPEMTDAIAALESALGIK